MLVLRDVKATAEQLPILRHDPRGVLIVRGAAGSGKTTTALLRLRFVVEFWQRQAERSGNNVRVLVLTFNRTLAGYVEALAREQVKKYAHVKIEVETFAKWALDRVGSPDILSHSRRQKALEKFGEPLGLATPFLCDEIAYLTGRFMPDQRDEYLNVKREGRGSSPQMPKPLRERLLFEVLPKYETWKQAHAVADWSDLAVQLALKPRQHEYDVVVVDETQDFQANQVRGILNFLTELHSLTFVLDSAQRIYPHFFRWNEVGISAANAVRTLGRNYRNTRQIAEFAKPIIDGLDLGPDGTLPDFSATVNAGRLPVVLRGRFSAQTEWVVRYIQSSVNLVSETVVFLHPKGWFKEIKSQLDRAGLAFEDLTRERDWPTGDTNIAISTMHSAKGLEFDHVILLGLNAEVTPHGHEEGDVNLEDLRRLLAMAVGRARRMVILGYKPAEESALVSFFAPGTFSSIDV